MEHAISLAHRLLDHFAIRLSRLFLYFGGLEFHRLSLCKSRFGWYDLLPVWKLVLALCPHMDEILVLTVDLSPLFNEFSGIMKSTMGDLSSPLSTPSSTSSSVTPGCKTLQSLQNSILHVLRQIRHHFDSVISLSRPPAISVSSSSSIDQTIALFFSTWLDHVTSVFDDLSDLIQAMDTVFSAAQDVSSATLYVHATHATTRS